MRIPADPENWTLNLAERLLAIAWKKFEQYEKHVDFDKSQEEQDRWYLPYWFAREDAVKVASVAMWWVNVDRILP